MNGEQAFLEKIKIFSDFHMPRYDDLPEIELYMDQVISVTDKYLGALSASGEPLLTPSMINNYVKSRVIPPPEKKKYSREHLAKLLVICLLKPTMEISAISDIIEKSEKLYGTQKMLDTFAETYEKRISALAREISAELKKSGETEDILISVATENALKAGPMKTLAHFAYFAVRKEEPEEKNEKAEKKKEKNKDKTKSEA
jgi:hypothetical protein